MQDGAPAFWIAVVLYRFWMSFRSELAPSIPMPLYVIVETQPEPRPKSARGLGAVQDASRVLSARRLCSPRAWPLLHAAVAMKDVPVNGAHSQDLVRMVLIHIASSPELVTHVDRLQIMPGKRPLFRSIPGANQYKGAA